MAQIKIWDPWEPYRLIEEMRKSMNLSSDLDDAMQLNMDMYEDENGNIVIEAQVPNFNPEDLDINIEDRYLTIAGKSKEEKTEEDKKRKYHLKEVREASFSRTVMLPTPVDIDNVEAHCEKGMLKLVMPKIVKTGSKKIEIK